MINTDLDLADLGSLECKAPTRVFGWCIVTLKNGEEFGCHLMEQNIAGQQLLRAEIRRTAPPAEDAGGSTLLAIQYFCGDAVKRIVVAEESVAKSRNDRLKMTRTYGGSDV